MTLPNFIVIGAAKAGTSSLWHYLNQHPEVYMSPVKEPGFFAWEGDELDFQGPGDQERRLPINNYEDYCKLFENVGNEIAIGEACTDYLYSPKAPKKIRYYIPDAKLIAILRNPVDRAYSQFLGNTKDGYEPLNDFSQALKEEENRINNNWHYRWHYRARGFYYMQLSRYFNEFDPNQIRIYLYEDWVSNPIEILQDIFEFIGITKEFIPDTSVRLNSSPLQIKNKKLHNFLNQRNLGKTILKPLFPKQVRKQIRNFFINQNLTKSSLTSKQRKQLIKTYRQDILNLQQLIGRDLSNWLK